MYAIRSYYGPSRQGRYRLRLHGDHDETMAADLGVSLAQLAGDATLPAKIDLKRYVTETVGLPTLRDILEELKKPGRDPRAAFETITFRDDVREISDLQARITSYNVCYTKLLRHWGL